MDEQDTNTEESQRRGMDTPDHYIDLSKYETISDIDKEVKKLQQDIEIRRHVHQRMGTNNDDETTLILDEKIKLLEVERKKMLAEQEKIAGRVAVVMLFLVVVLPVTIFFPLAGAGLTAFIIFVHLLNRKAKRTKNNVDSKEETEAEKKRHWISSPHCVKYGKNTT